MPEDEQRISLCNSLHAELHKPIHYSKDHRPFTCMQKLFPKQRTIILIIYFGTDSICSRIRVGAVEGLPGYCLPLLYCRTPSLPFVPLVQLFEFSSALSRAVELFQSMEDWRIRPSNIHDYNWRVQSDSDGAAPSSPLSPK